jgi:hypothetical protein
MIQMITAQPDISMIAAPWQLSGQGAVLIIWQPEVRQIGLLIVADYQHSDAGPYQEILWIANVRSGAVQGHPSITRIYVSTQVSVDSGQHNWGIPKALAGFNITRHAQQWQCDVFTAQHEPIANIGMQPYGPSFPVNSRWLPESWLRLVQDWQGQRFCFAPQARGRARLARVRTWQVDAMRFAQINGRVIGAMMIEDFQMHFPVAQISSLASASPLA